MGNGGKIVRILKRSVTFTVRSGIVSLAVALLLTTLITDLAAKVDETAQIPSADAGRGPCAIDFRVIDSQQEPVANAWVYIEIRHGFLGLRKIELQVPTNAEGRARITGLSYETRDNPLEFRIQHGDDYRIIYHYPAGDCDAHLIVTLGSTPRDETELEGTRASR